MNKYTIFIMCLIFITTAKSENLFNFEFSNPNLLFTYVDKSQIDITFRFKNVSNERYDFYFQNCKTNCNSYGFGFGSHKFNLDKFSDTSPQYVSYAVNTEYFFLSYRLSNTVNSFTELGALVNLGAENLVLTKNNALDPSTSASYVRLEAGGFAKLFLEPKLIYIQRVYIIGGLSLYLKSVSDLSYDNQEFKKTELIGLNFLITLGAGLSF